MMIAFKIYISREENSKSIRILQQVSEGVDFGEAVDGFEFSAGVDEQHQPVVGEVADGENCEGSGAFEGVGEAEDAGADHGDENVGEGLELGGSV
ncbi:hypothetical protein L1987_07633 [Smallanthus sonchifolius]|uniref:Uncharacterized protein n=1 Tax=Smallanthus sonchifolius TaxID=185202 RepID=A0ACB9K0U5_9ASTR|nr:hypothetical protein L1987_07633 [Smallanthus sonchifolius]